MRTLLVTLLLVATTGTATAYCIAMPDDQASAYVKNGLKQAICLNGEIVQDTAVQNWQVKVNSALGKLDRDFVSEKLDALRPVEIPDYANPRPAWP